MEENSHCIHMTSNVFTDVQLEIIWQIIKIFQVFVEKVCSTGDISVHSSFTKTNDQLTTKHTRPCYNSYRQH